MLKGTTKIELTDVNTGETQVIEKHNAITGALQELFNPVFGHLTTESKLTGSSSGYRNLLGGLLLFNDRIDGDPLPLFAPESVKLVGCARYNLASTQGSKYVGSYDLNESVMAPENKMAKFVYNFTQAQANGTIGSVCLTHINGGLGVYAGDVYNRQNGVKLANSMYASPTVKLTRDSKDRNSAVTEYGDKEYLFAIDPDNDVAHYFRITSASTVVFVKRTARLKSYSLFGNIAEIVEERTVNLSTALPASIPANNAYSYDVENNTLYLVFSTSQEIALNGTITVIRINLSTYSATQTTITNTHTEKLESRSAFVYREKVYFIAVRRSATLNGVSSGLYTVVSINLADNTVEVRGSVTGISDSSYDPKVMFAMDNRIYWQSVWSSSNAYAGGLHVTDCSVPADDTNTTICGIDCVEYHQSHGGGYYVPICTPVLNHPMMYYISFASGTFSEGFFYLAHYLGTVNNLATPIVKAPTQTMKITYTIQEV